MNISYIMYRMKKRGIGVKVAVMRKEPDLIDPWKV